MKIEVALITEASQIQHHHEKPFQLHLSLPNIMCRTSAVLWRPHRRHLLPFLPSSLHLEMWKFTTCNLLWVRKCHPAKCRILSQNRASRASPSGGTLSNHGDPPNPTPLCLSHRRSSAFVPLQLHPDPFRMDSLATDATHLMRFFDRMRGALTAAPTRLLPVNHIPHAAPTTLSPKPKAMPKLA